jgi:hypothetical protein
MARLNHDERKVIFDAINCMRQVNRELLDTYTVSLRTLQETEEAWTELERLFNDGNWWTTGYWGDYIIGALEDLDAESKAADKIVEEAETNETE